MKFTKILFATAAIFSGTLIAFAQPSTPFTSSSYGLSGIVTVPALPTNTAALGLTNFLYTAGGTNNSVSPILIPSTRMVGFWMAVKPVPGATNFTAVATWARCPDGVTPETVPTISLGASSVTNSTGWAVSMTNVDLGACLAILPVSFTNTSSAYFTNEAMGYIVKPPY